MNDFVVWDAGQAVAERRWQIWRICAAEASPGGCRFDLFCDCIRSEVGAFAELVGEYATKAEAVSVAQVRQVDLERVQDAEFQRLKAQGH